MTDRHAGYVITLVQNLHEEDSKDTISAIMQLRGVVSVAPIVASAEIDIATARATNEFRDKLLKTFFEVNKPTDGK